MAAESESQVAQPPEAILRKALAEMVMAFCRITGLEGFAGTVTLTGGGIRADGTLGPFHYVWPVEVCRPVEERIGTQIAVAQRHVVPLEETVAKRTKEVSERQHKVMRQKKKTFMEPQFHRKERFRG